MPDVEVILQGFDRVEAGVKAIIAERDFWREESHRLKAVIDELVKEHDALTAKLTAQ